MSTFDGLDGDIPDVLLGHPLLNWDNLWLNGTRGRDSGSQLRPLSFKVQLSTYQQKQDFSILLMRKSDWLKFGMNMDKLHTRSTFSYHFRPLFSKYLVERIKIWSRKRYSMQPSNTSLKKTPDNFTQVSLQHKYKYTSILT